MNSRPLLLVSSLGLAAGIAAGSFTTRDSGEAGSPAAYSAQPASARIASTPAAADAALRLAFPSDDGRIARVFSALQQTVRLRQRAELFEALRDLVAADLPALVKHAASLPQATASELLPPLVERWFELDPHAAEAWVRAHPKNWRMLGLWAKADPEGAFHAASELKGWPATALLGEALDALYGKDAAAKVARARTLPPGQLRDNAIFRELQQWAEQDPAAAYAALAEIPAGQTRDDVRQSVLRAWAERDPAAALAKLAELLPTLKAGVLGHELVTSTAEQIANKNPRLALEWLSGIPAEFRSAPAIAAARQWAEKEPLAALEWCLANGVDIAQANWRGTSHWDPAVLGGAMERAPAETFAMLGALPPGAERDRLLECAFMESLWHTPGKQLFDGDAALAWQFYDQLPEDAQIAKATLFGVKRAEHGDLADLGAWGQNFASGPARFNAITGAMDTAYGRHPSRAETLLATTAPGADRDAALRGLADATRTSAPAAAAARALSIGDPNLRREVLAGVVLPWLKTNASASREWLQNNAAIPAAWKQEWLWRREVQ